MNHDIELGLDASADKFIEAVGEKADMVRPSSLITATMSEQKRNMGWW